MKHPDEWLAQTPALCAILGIMNQVFPNGDNAKGLRDIVAGIQLDAVGTAMKSVCEGCREGWELQTSTMPEGVAHWRQHEGPEGQVLTCKASPILDAMEKRSRETKKTNGKPRPPNIIVPGR